MLWLIRRPSARRMQRAALNLVPSRYREAARLSGVKQERFARKYGLAVVSLSLNLIMLSVVASLAYAFMLEAFERGWIVPRP